MAKRSPTPSAPANPKSWTRATLPRAVLIAGPESALREEAVAAVKKAAFGKQESDGWAVLHGAMSGNESEALTPAAVLDEVCTRSMFAADDELKVVLVRSAELLLDKHFKVFEEQLDTIPETAVLVFELASLGKLKATNFFKKLAGGGAVIECDALAGEFDTSALELRIEKRAQELGLALEHGALVALLARSSKSLGVIEEELAKLALALKPANEETRGKGDTGKGGNSQSAESNLSASPRPRVPASPAVRVTEHDIAEICATTNTATAFHFVDALLDGDARRALEVLGTLFERGIADAKKPGKLITQEDAIVMVTLGALTYKLAMLQDIRAGMDAGKSEQAACADAKVFGYRANEVTRTLRKHSGASLRRAMEALFRTYLELRMGGGVEPRAVMERLVFRTISDENSKFKIQNSK